MSVRWGEILLKKADHSGPAPEGAEFSALQWWQAGEDALEPRWSIITDGRHPGVLFPTGRMCLPSIEVLRNTSQRHSRLIPRTPLLRYQVIHEFHALAPSSPSR